MRRSFPRRSQASRPLITPVVTLTVALVGAAVFSVPGVAAQVPVPVPVGGPPVTGVGGGSGATTPTAAPTIAPVQAGPTTAPPVTTAAPSTSTPVPSVPPPSGSVVPTESSLPSVPVITPVPIGPGTTVKGAGSTTTTIVAATTPAQLRDQVLAALAGAGGDRSALVSIDGAAVVDVGSGLLRPPASTQKVYVAGAALSVLGPDFRFVTSVRSVAPVAPGGVVAGDLTLVVSGDPSFTSTHLNKLAADVAAAGVRTVTGRLIVDDSHFDRTLANDGWKRSFVPGEVGPLSAFLLDGNHRADVPTLTDPALANLTRFKSALTKAGVTVVGSAERGVTLPGSEVLAKRTSAPLSELVSHMVKKSDNTYAEAVLKEIGAATGVGSAAGGIAEITRQFDRFGVDRPLLADGSGLSSINRSTPALQVNWLAKLDASRVGPQLRASLPVACVDGTLRNRMCATPAAGNVTAKTGTLDNVSSLAGYATTRSGRRVVFSILLARVPSTSRANAAIDRAMIAVTSYAG